MTRDWLKRVAASWGALAALSACADSTDQGATQDAGPNTLPSTFSSSEPEEATPDSGPLFGSEAPSVTVEVTATESTDPPDEGGDDAPNAQNPIKVCPEAKASGADPRLDDFEDGNDLIPVVDAREGGWYSYDDSSAEQTLSWEQDETAPGTGSGVMHVVGGPFDQYAGVGLVPRWSSGALQHCLYDASYYDGLRFWVRGTGGVRLALQNPSVRPVSEGGTCPDTEACYDSHGFDVDLTAEWRLIELPFAQAMQGTWGRKVGAFDPTQVWVVEFQFYTGVSYELWVDDLNFYVAPGSADAGTDTSTGATSTEPLDGGPGASDAGGDPDASTDASTDASVHHPPDASTATDAGLGDASLPQVDASTP